MSRIQREKDNLSSNKERTKEEEDAIHTLSDISADIKSKQLLKKQERQKKERERDEKERQMREKEK